MCLNVAEKDIENLSSFGLHAHGNMHLHVHVHSNHTHTSNNLLYIENSREETVGVYVLDFIFKHYKNVPFTGF